MLQSIVAIASVMMMSANTSFQSVAQSPDNDEWAALKGSGKVLLMRHALAPGTGDPSGFQLGDCNTQRNLSETGREQAIQAGNEFRRTGWCRDYGNASGKYYSFNGYCAAIGCCCGGTG